MHEHTEEVQGSNHKGRKKREGDHHRGGDG